MSTFGGFPEGTAKFLRELWKNNEKAWFVAHRDDYQAFYVEPALAFVAAIGPRLQKISPSVNFEPKINGSLFRINRDVRFSKDKRPYKDHIDLWFWHGDKRGWASPGFFFRMSSDRLILGAGMHRFEKPQLDAFRSAVVDAERGEVAGESRRPECATPAPMRSAARPERACRAGSTPITNVPRSLLHEGLFAASRMRLARLRRRRIRRFLHGHFRAMWPISRWILDEVIER